MYTKKDGQGGAARAPGRALCSTDSSMMAHTKEIGPQISHLKLNYDRNVARHKKETKQTDIDQKGQRHCCELFQLFRGLGAVMSGRREGRMGVGNKGN